MSEADLTRLAILGGVILLTAVAYFLPAIVALLRRHQSFGGVFVLNFFLGWTFIGWVAALAWASSATRTRDPVGGGTFSTGKPEPIDYVMLLEAKRRVEAQPFDPYGQRKNT